MAINGLRYESGEYATQSDLATNAGLNLIVTQSLSATSSVSLNNCFSATYDNYRIVYRGNGSSGANLEARLRVGGVDASAGNYSRQYLVVDNASVSAGRTTGNTSYVLAAFATTIGGCSCDIYGPAIAANTAFATVIARGDTVTQLESGVHSVATAYDGITLTGGGGSTMTGSLSIYGYRK
jgi:hypothetical protein